MTAMRAFFVALAASGALLWTRTIVPADPLLWNATVAPNSSAAHGAAQDPSRASALPPARPGLVSVPLPPLDALELPVAEQLREVQRSLEKLLVGTSRERADLAEVFGSAGRVYHAYEFFDAAEASYLNASRLAPGEVRWLHLLGFLYQQTGRPREAADKYVAALEARPDDRVAIVHLGEVYLQLNRLQDAREEFQKVVSTFPAAASNGLGEVALREGRFEEAIVHFRAALARIPEGGSIHYSLAMAYRGLGRLDEARSHLQRQGPGGVRAVDLIVDELQRLVRGERALVIQGRRAFEAGQFQSAADAFRNAVNAAPASVTPRVNLGLALAQLGNAEGAAEQFEAAFRLDSDNHVAHVGLGMLLARLGRDREAVDHLRTAFRQAPGDAPVSGELIRVLLRLGRKDEAIEILTEARSFLPDDEGALLNLSILLAEGERYREAVALLEDGHRRFPDRASTTTTLARLLASSPDLSLRDGRRALDLAMSVYAASPAPVHGETVALALAELGRCDEALEWMRRAVAEAERVADRTETARLRGEIPKYEGASCRPAGQ